MKPARTAKVSRPLHAAASLAARRPGLVLVLTAVLALAGLASAIRLQPDAGVDTLVGTDSPAYAATETLRERFGDDAIIVLVRGDLQKLLLSQDLERLLALEGCLAGAVPRARAAAGRPRRALRPARTRQAGQGRPRARHVRQHGGARAARRLRARVLRARILADAAEAAARNRARRDGRSKAAAARAGAQARKDAEARFTNELLTLATRYGLSSVPQLDDPAFVSTLVFDATKPPGTPKRRFAYLFPSNAGARARPHGARAGTPEGRAERRAAQRRDRARARRRRAGRVQAAQRRDVHRHRRARRRGGPHRRDHRLDARPADRRAAHHGDDARARLPRAPAAAAARDRARRRRADVRRAVARRLVADDGVDRGAAGAHRPRCRLRDPAAGAHRRRAGRGRGARRRRGRSAAALLGRARVAVAAAATAAGFAVLAFSPVPMVRGFGILLVAGIAIAFALALLAGTAALVLAERAAPPPWLAGSARGSRAGARRSARCTAAGCSCATPARAYPRRPARARVLDRPPGARPGDRPRRRGVRLAARHADARGVRHPAARAAGHAGAARPRRAAAIDAASAARSTCSSAAPTSRARR